MSIHREPITGTVLRWAIAESGYAITDLAAYLRVEDSIIQAWIAETDRPTVGQLTKLSARLKRPRLLFFLPHPPADSTPSTFRHAATQDGRIPLTPEERLTLRRAQRIQAIVSPLLRREDRPPVNIPQFSPDDSPATVGSALREWIAPNSESRHMAFPQWREAFQQRQILVLALPVRFGHSPQASKKQPTLRGFALPDTYAPTIAISTADNPAARSFTLFHELVHLAIDRVQSCGLIAPYNEQTLDNAAQMEYWCDLVAGRALIPLDQLAEIAKDKAPDLDLVRKVADYFKVSLRATTIALIRDTGAPRELYREVEQEWPLLDRHKTGGGQGGGRTRARIRLDECGERAIGTILNAHDRRLISEVQVRRWLDFAACEMDEARAITKKVA